MKNELMENIKSVAILKSRAFCYSCYRVAASGRCECCGSDDLMRELPGVGCEYGVDWIIEHIVSENLSEVDLEADFENFISSVYPETTMVGWLELSTVEILKASDPISWRIAQSEYIDNLESDGEIVSFDNGKSYYRVSEVEEFLETELPKGQF